MQIQVPIFEAIVETPVGRIKITADDDQILSIDFTDDAPAADFNSLRSTKGMDDSFAKAFTSSRAALYRLSLYVGVFTKINRMPLSSQYFFIFNRHALSP